MPSVVSLKDADSRGEYGGKAANLSRLLSAGLPVPTGFAVGISSFDGERLMPEASSKVQSLVDASKLYAVRSSAVNEDAQDASWAGQFETFLNVKPKDVLETIEKCHSSTKARAKAYRKKMTTEKVDFKIAVVVQEMLTPDYAGVLFTRNPLTGSDEFVVEYVKGMGEGLVSGRIDPERLVVKENFEGVAPFDLKSLVSLARVAEKTFGVPQDIEFASQNNTIWLLQSRPITKLPTRDELNLGEPADLFYWGPSRTEPLYMSDFMVAVGDAFNEQFNDPAWPNPPKSIALFHNHQMVWLSSSKEFNAYAVSAFETYLQTRDVSKEQAEWNSLCKELDKDAKARSKVFEKLVSALKKTIRAEFSLYAAETVLGRMLARLTENDRQEAWQEF